MKKKKTFRSQEIVYAMDKFVNEVITYHKQVTESRKRASQVAETSETSATNSNVPISAFKESIEALPDCQPATSYFKSGKISFFTEYTYHA